MSRSKKHTALQIILIAVLVIIIGAVSFSIWVTQHYKAIIIERLPGWVAKSTDSVYNISVKDISINIITRRVTIREIKLWPDTNQIKRLKDVGRAPSNVFTLNIPQAQLRGIVWGDLVADQKLYCERLTIFKPSIKILSSPRDTTALKKLVSPSKNKQSFIQELGAGKIEIQQPNITYHFISKTDSFYCFIKNGNIVLDDWELNNSRHKDTSRFFYARKGSVRFSDFEYRKPGALYNIRSTSIDFLSDQKSIQLLGLRIKTVVSREVFYKQVKEQKEIYNLNFPSIKFINLDWVALLNSKKLMAERIDIDTPWLDIYFSRLLPPNKKSKVGKYPHQLLHQLKLKVNIDTIKITNGHFKYTEINEKTKKAGILLFDGIHGTINNVTNIDSLVAKNKNCIINLRGYFMHRSEMSATFDLVLSDTTGGFSINGYLKNLNADQINEQAKALALAQINSFHVTRMDMHIQGNQNHASGHFTILYDNLSIQLQKVDSGAHLKARPVLSFLANNIFLYRDNPMPGKDVRTADTYVPRDKLKSFFNQIWKNIYQAAQKTALRNQKIVDLLGKDNGKDGKPKKKNILKTLFGKKKKK